MAIDTENERRVISGVYPKANDSINDRDKRYVNFIYYMSYFAQGKVCVSFTGRKPEVTFTGRKPSTTFTGRKPEVTFTGGDCS